MPKAYTLEREYVRRWAARTEHLDNTMAQELNGEAAVHAAMDAQGGFRRVEAEPESPRP